MWIKLLLIFRLLTRYLYLQNKRVRHYFSRRSAQAHFWKKKKRVPTSNVFIASTRRKTCKQSQKHLMRCNESHLSIFCNFQPKAHSQMMQMDFGESLLSRVWTSNLPEYSETNLIKLLNTRTNWIKKIETKFGKSLSKLKPIFGGTSLEWQAKWSRQEPS